MKVLCVDNIPDERATMRLSVQQLGHEADAKTGKEAMASTVQEALSYDVAVVDQKLEDGITGQEVGHALRAKNQNIVLIMLTAYATLEKAVEAMKSSGFDDYIAKGTSQELELLRKALMSAEKQAQLWAVQQVAHGNSPLFQHTRHLIGIDKVIYELSERLDAFFMWQSGEWNYWPEQDRPKFVSCLLLEGEPGCAKTDICKAVVTAFNNNEDSFLPKDLGPTNIAKGWKKTLRESLEPLYLKAVSASKVVVIVADDLAWPSIGSMHASDMAPEWLNYMQIVRDCMKDADRINRGQEPLIPWFKKNYRTGAGRILWLLAKNAAEDVGQAYAPIVDFMTSFRFQFPRDDPSRRQILEGYAVRHGMRFDTEAATLAVASLRPPAYRGREFVGDESSGKGFAYWCVERVKKMIRATPKNSSAVQRVISIEVVREWLATEQHRTIVEKEVNSPSVGVHKVEAAGHPGAQAPRSESQLVNGASDAWAEGTTHSTVLDPCALGQLCKQIEATNGECIQNSPTFVLKTHGAAMLRDVLAVFYSHYKEINNVDRFNKLFGYKAPHLGRATVEIKHELHRLSEDRTTAALFRPKSGTKFYGLRDLVAEGKALHNKGVTLSVLREATRP